MSKVFNQIDITDFLLKELRNNNLTSKAFEEYIPQIQHRYDLLMCILDHKTSNDIKIAKKILENDIDVSKSKYFHPTFLLNLILKSNDLELLELI